jgi:uncharacterized protein (DUF305 family)
MTRFVRTILALLAALALTAAVAQGGHGHGHGDPPAGGMPGGMMMSPPAGGAGMAPGAGHAMTSAAFDELSFLQHMIPHHQEAIDTATALLEMTQRPELRALLEDVVATQTAEVALMRGWIAEWYPGEPLAVDYAPMMRDLAGAPVEERERAWLEDMVMHHMMAVRDARSLLVGGWATRPEVAQLAVDIVQGQMAEIQLMRGWLASWFGDSTAMGMGMGMHGGDGADRGMGMGTMGGMGMQGHGAGGMGMMGGHGGMGGMGGMGMHGSQGAAMRGPAHFDASAVEALARAYLAGAGGGDVVELHGPTITFRVAVLIDGAERTLLVDATTGEVRWDDER